MWTLRCGKAFKLREPPKATPTTLVSKGMMGNEGNDLKTVKSVWMIEREMGNPHAKPLCVGPVLRCAVVVNLGKMGFSSCFLASLFTHPCSESLLRCSLMRRTWGRSID